jgi:hypothetical protein
MGALIQEWNDPVNCHFTYGGRKLAETFVFTPTDGTSNTIDSIAIPLLRYGSLSGNMTGSIYGTTAGVPSGAALGSGTIVANSVPTGGTNWTTFTFTSPVTVVSGTTYAVVLGDPGTGDANNGVAWFHKSNGYPGIGYIYNLTGWELYCVGWPSCTADNRDFSFRIYGSYVAPPVVNIPTVVTGAASGITSDGFTLAGNVTSDGGGTITSRGIAYSSTVNPPITPTATTLGTTGSYSVTVSGLTSSLLYHARAFATNSAGTGYGAVVDVTTLAPEEEPEATCPSVITGVPSFITTHDYDVDATVADDGGDPVTEYGFVYSDSVNPPTIADTKVAIGSGTGSYTYHFGDYVASYGQWVRAYATNGVGTCYGDAIWIETLPYEDTELTPAVCDLGCDCLPQTATEYEITVAKILVTDTEITVKGEAPDCGYGMWIPCEPDKGEIFKITGASYNSGNDTTLLTVIRGLAYDGCDETGDPTLVYEHPQTQKLVIGSSEIHYYYCDLCEKLDCAENKLRCCVASYDDILAITDPMPGDRCVAWNSGEPVMYIYDCGDSGEGWKPICCEHGQVDCAFVRPCISAVAPVYYDEGTGVISFQGNPCHFEVLDGQLSLLVPQAAVGHGGTMHNTNVYLSNQHGYVFPDTIVNFPATGDCSPRLITISWQMDTSVKPNGSGWGTTVAFSLDVYKRTNGGTWILLKDDKQERQLTNQASDDSNSAFGNNEMQTITIFDIETDTSSSHDYCIVYDYFGYGTAQAYFSDYSWDWSYITLAKK